MYNNSDVARKPNPPRKPDPPGDEDFVHRYVDSHFDTTGSMSTMTDPPASVSQLDKHSLFSITKNIRTLSTINEDGCSLDVSSNDRPMMDKNDNDTLRLDDVRLLSTVSFPYHSFMMKYIREYAISRRFLH